MPKMSDKKAAIAI